MRQRQELSHRRQLYIVKKPEFTLFDYFLEVFNGDAIETSVLRSLSRLESAYIRDVFEGSNARLFQEYLLGLKFEVQLLMVTDSGLCLNGCMLTPE